eukprot:TRINITY_DN2732_c0_g1_i1.p1 TRINITY_DN2732_c0_g1~~TRINITY_DN2732_c0_g1_i1.p1  ORF type:complete len:249 (+),score=25.87 TRINITY_DN2732_c0_g1_i1:882-1628(+)
MSGAEQFLSGLKAQFEEILSLVQVCLSSILEGKIPPMDIFTLLLSKGLGYAILVGATIVKIPQIVAIVGSGSAEGLTAISFELELIGMSISASYGYLKSLPINTYGEAVALWIQSLFLLIMVYYYNQTSFFRRTLVFGVVIAFAIAVIQGSISVPIIDQLMSGTILIFVAARIPQILSNFRNGGTGQLSSLSTFIVFGGSLARIFTSVRENAGSQMIMSYCVSALLNGILFSQIVFYKLRESRRKKTQ